jgi:NitT/TauT family transport system substrate-binding protein
MRSVPRIHRLICVALLAVLALAGCGDDDDSGGDGGGGGPQTLRVASLPIADLGAYFYASEHGIFAKHDLRVEDTSVAGGAEGISAMTGGEVDLAYTNNVSVLLSGAQGLPIKIVSGANLNRPTGKTDMAAMMAPEDIRSPDQLAGTTIASNAVNNINWLYARAWLRQQGVDPDEAEYVEVPFPEQPAALMSGEIAGTLIPEPFATQLRQEGATSLGFPYRIGPDRTTFIASFVATPQFAEENADAIGRFREALDEAIAEMEDSANADRVTAALQANTELTEEAIGELTLPVYTTEVSRPLLEDMKTRMEEEGMFEGQAPDVGSLIATP